MVGLHNLITIRIVLSKYILSILATSSSQNLQSPLKKQQLRCYFFYNLIIAARLTNRSLEEPSFHVLVKLIHH
jgi:hypothetical protein